jgi:phosphoribosylamine--glycine ligase
VDALTEAGIPVFGPTRAAARIETSKAFCREIAEAVGVPMADGEAFEAGRQDDAVAYATGLAERGTGVVVKADGLAAGKGVVVCRTADEAAQAIDAMNGPIVVEERLTGPEASVIAICDGRDALALPISRDHKRLGDADTGPNTGGMGAYSPLPDLHDDDADAILDRFHRPVLAELARRDTPFKGALYAGLMLTDAGPRLLEFNARFGDPETQVILPRLATPLGPVLLAAARGRLREVRDGLAAPRLPVVDGATVGIVLASFGYPGALEAGAEIRALDDAGHLRDEPPWGVIVFHSGTSRATPGHFLTRGGRVLTVVGRGADLANARLAAERAADAIGWPGMHRRHDIAAQLPEPAGSTR